MRYIYYVVAALIFLAVVNLASRFIGNDTQELLSDLNPDEQVTQATTEEGAEAAASPIVSLDASPIEATEVVPAIEQVATNLEPTGSSSAPARLAASAEVKPESLPTAEISTVVEGAIVKGAVVESVIEGAVDSQADSAIAAVASGVAEVTTSVEGQAAVASDITADRPADTSAARTAKMPAATELEAEVIASAEAVADTTATAVNSGIADVTPAAIADASDPVSTEAIVAAAVVPEVIATEVTLQPVAIATNIATPVDTTIPAKATELAAPQVAAVVATVEPETNIAPITNEPETLVEPEEPSLIKSLGNSAGSAATAVVGGAQQAVETVVEAARSLIEKDDDIATVAASAAINSEAPQAIATQALAAPAVAVVAAAVTDATRIENAAALEVTSAADPAPVQAPVNETNHPAANTAVAVAKVEPVAAVENAAPPAAAPEAKTEPTVVATNTTKREFATAPTEVLALVNKHPGKVLIVGFFSPNCRDCKPSLGWLNEMRRKYWAQGLQVIGVNLGTQVQAKNYLQDAPVSFEILHDSDRKLAAAFWLAEQPSTYIIDASGRMLSMHQGHSAAQAGEYEDAIRAALEQR